MLKILKISGLVFLLPLFSPAQQSPAQVAKLDSLISQYSQLNWNGVVYVGSKDNVLYKKAFGYAEIETKKPMLLTTWFKTESVGKMFTAIRIMQLVAAGKLKLNTTVADILPDWKIPQAEKITIEHLLTHTSGLSSPWDHPDYVFGKIYSAAEMKKIIETAPVIFPTPGEKSYYSNSGYVLMEKMIEKLDKRSFEKSIRQHIFKPAGMKYTRSLNDSVLPVYAAQPYYQVTTDRFAKDKTRYGDGKASGAGGWMSTAGDLFLFAQAYLNEKLLPRKWMDVQLTNNHSLDTSSPYRRYGMGLLNERPLHTFIVGHNGGGKGFSADVYFDMYSGEIVVFCSNLYGTGYELTKRAFAILNNQAYSAPVSSAPVRLSDWLLSQNPDNIPPVTDSVLEKLGIKKPDEFLFFTVYDNLAELEEYRLAGIAIKAARERYPQSVYSWIKSGENAAAMKQLDTAKEFFKKALQVAEANKEKDVINLVNNKLLNIGN